MSPHPTECDLCGQPTGDSSFWVHRALAHPETVMPIDPPTPMDKRTYTRRTVETTSDYTLL